MRSRPGLIGWLYADMVLALFVVFLAVAGQAPPPAPKPTPAPTAAPAATPTPCDRSVLLAKQVVELPPSPGTNPALPNTPALRSGFARFQPGVAGIVLTFVHDPDVNRATALAGQVNSQLQAADPAMFLPAGQTIYEPFWSGDGATPGTVTFYAYFRNPACR